MNNPTTYIDPTGLAPCAESPCATYPGGPCAYAKNEGDDDGDYGGVICCNGKKIVCAWNYPSGTFPGIVRCTRVHEYDHLDDVDCDPAAYSRPGWRPGKDPTHEECNAISIHITCLINGRKSECSKYTGAKKKKCLADYRTHLCMRCARMKRLNCPPSKIPKNCTYC